jgi:hypothetical protein
VNRPGRLLLAAALGAAAASSAPYPPAADYATACVVVDPTTVEGFVTNRGGGVLPISGLIVFGVAGDPALGRPVVRTHATALIPPGETVSIGRARLPSALLPTETCRLDISEALR